MDNNLKIFIIMDTEDGTEQQSFERTWQGEDTVPFF